MKEINTIKDLNESLALLPLYVTALHHDSLIYFNKEATVCTPERREMLLNDISLIENITSSIKNIAISFKAEEIAE